MLILFVAQSSVVQCTLYTPQHKTQTYTSVSKAEENEKISCCYILYTFNAKFLCISNARQFSSFLFCFIYPHRLQPFGQLLPTNFSILFAALIYFFCLIFLFDYYIQEFYIYYAFGIVNKIKNAMVYEIEPMCTVSYHSE